MRKLDRFICHLRFDNDHLSLVGAATESHIANYGAPDSFGFAMTNDHCQISNDK